jgi:hypothetical protein
MKPRTTCYQTPNPNYPGTQVNKIKEEEINSENFLISFPRQANFSQTTLAQMMQTI